MAMWLTESLSARALQLPTKCMCNNLQKPFAILCKKGLQKTYGESPEECILREVKEETGYTLTSYRYRGLVTFVFADIETEYMSLFTADGFEGEQIPCNEGTLEWVDINNLEKLNLWEGDKIFFRLLEENIPFFSLKLVYNKDGKLETAVLNGTTIY